MSERLDIVALVNNNPLTKLSSDYGSKIIQKIQERFSSEDQQMFVANFYCYLNYHSKRDFVIPLDGVWKWLGYGRIEECKRLLVKSFEKDIDYKVEIYFPQDGGKKTKPTEEPEKIEKRNCKNFKENTDYKVEIYFSETSVKKTKPIEEQEEQGEEEEPEKIEKGGDYKLEIFASEDAEAKTEPIEKPEKSEKKNQKNFKEDEEEGEEEEPEKIEKRGDYKIEKAASANAEAGRKPTEEQKKIETRGRKPEYITLTINCFKELCLLSKTSKSRQIHRYYLGLEELINELVSEQAEELRQKLQVKDKEIENSLVSICKNKQVLYLIQVEPNIIKFGYTKNIEKRLKEHRTEFGKNIVLKKIIETVHNRELEQLVKLKLSHVIIEKKYKNNQTELIQLSEEFTYDDLKSKIEEFKENLTEELVPSLIKEITELKLKLSEYENISKKYEIQEKNKLLNKFTEPIKPPAQPIKPNQDRIQVYDTNLKLLKTFETMRDACDEIELYKDAIPQSIYRSIQNNTIYKGYRFWKIDRSQPIKEYEIPETFELSKEQTYQRVVQIKNNEIVGVWSCTKDASENMFNSIKSQKFIPKNTKLIRSTVSQINKSITNSLSVHTNHSAYEHYWYRECDIPENMLEKFEEYKSTNVLPELIVHKNNKRVYKFDENGNLVHTYNSITEARKAEKLTEKTIGKYITEKTLHNAHYFSLIKTIVQE